MKILAIILARGGSKRIPNKNIADLCGKPLIQYTIEAAKKSKLINYIIVSTDSPQIAKVARKCGALVPFYRLPSLSQWDSTEYDAIRFTLDMLKDRHGYEPDLIVKLFPTSPFRTSEDIDKAIRLALANPDADSVRSVKLCKEHPCKMWVAKKNRITPLLQTDQEMHTLSYQLLPEVYVNNASFDVIRPRTIYEKYSVTGTTIIPFIMPEERSFDINTPLDLRIARMLMKQRKEKRR